ncbi:hypothetical protein Btru_045514 [Bulinus truncatus]|nr:hypothetical protein Btru_045514 [Bulinus truncatus]
MIKNRVSPEDEGSRSVDQKKGELVKKESSQENEAHFERSSNALKVQDDTKVSEDYPKTTGSQSTILEDEGVYVFMKKSKETKKKERNLSMDQKKTYKKDELCKESSPRTGMIIARLFGDYLDDENKKKIYNIRYCLSVLINLFKKEECLYAVNKKNEKIYECVFNISCTAVPKYKKYEPQEMSNKEFTSYLEKNELKECFLLCNGTKESTKDLKYCVDHDKAIVVIKGSGGIADILAYAQENININAGKELIDKRLKKAVSTIE